MSPSHILKQSDESTSSDVTKSDGQLSRAPSVGVLVGAGADLAAALASSESKCKVLEAELAQLRKDSHLSNGRSSGSQITASKKDLAKNSFDVEASCHRPLLVLSVDDDIVNQEVTLF
jgi:hypothetical protein